MSSLRDRLERGYGARAQRIIDGLLLVASVISGDPRPAYVASTMIVAQVIWPAAAPIALLWSAIDRRVPPDRLGNLYFDKNGTRGAALVCCVVLTSALALMHWSSVPFLGRILLALPAASCTLGGTVGFCAGCSCYVFGRDLLVRFGIVSPIQGACDVDVDH